MFDRLDPLAAVVEAGTGVDGAKDRVWAGSGLVNILDQELGGEEEIFTAALVEARCASVTIDGAVIGEFVSLAEQVGVAPIEEILF